MSLKTALLNLPLGGGKGGVAVNPKELSEGELEQVAREYVRAFQPKLGPHQDIPAPDVGTNSQVIDWMVDEYSKLTGDRTKASFTGKSVKNGGLELREEATGRGGVYVLEEFLQLKKKDLTSTTVAVHGFGNVGFYFAKIAQQEFGMKITAVSNSRYSLFSDKGFDLSEATYDKDSAEQLKTQSTHQALPDEIIACDADVLVCAALADTITKDNQAGVRANAILELANSPTTIEAYESLEERSTSVIPDILANSGGVAVSYLEWKANIEQTALGYEEATKKLKDRMELATKQTIDFMEGDSYTLKEASLALAIKKLGN
jgi:glutamate dehydrogenase/leucine dehydrogenase